MKSPGSLKSALKTKAPCFGFFLSHETFPSFFPYIRYEMERRSEDYGKRDCSERIEKNLKRPACSGDEIKSF
ncbi:hypothetical protein BavelB3_18320 [Bacillus velezensis]